MKWAVQRLDDRTGIPCTGKPSTDMENETGYLYGYVEVKGQSWGIVLWSGEDEPDLYKLELLTRKHTQIGGETK